MIWRATKMSEAQDFLKFMEEEMNEELSSFQGKLGRPLFEHERKVYSAGFWAGSQRYGQFMNKRYKMIKKEDWDEFKLDEKLFGKSKTPIRMTEQSEEELDGISKV
jgi:hypothetical protein